MNPALQTQIFDALRQQFVQVDGGTLATTAVLWQILVEMRIANYIAMEVAGGRVPADDLENLRKDLLNEPIFSRQA